MKAIRFIGNFLIASSLLIFLAANFTGCQRQEPISPLADLEVNQLAPEKNLVQSNIGTIQILGVNDYKNYSFEKSVSNSLPANQTKNEVQFYSAKHKIFYAEKLIEEDDGGRIVLGNKDFGKSILVFPEEALKKDMIVSFQWASYGTFQGMVNSLEFGPHGTVFNRAVRVELSYKNADLTGVEEEDLRIFYYNEELEMWELIGGEVDTQRKVVKGKLYHFSRYAIAFSR